MHSKAWTKHVHFLKLFGEMPNISPQHLTKANLIKYVPSVSTAIPTH